MVLTDLTSSVALAAASNAETDLGRVSVVAPGTPGYYSVRCE